MPTHTVALGISVVTLGLVCAVLGGALPSARADSTIEVIKGTSKQRVRPGESSAPSENAAAAQEFPRVELFLTDWCPYCRKLEAFLKANGVPYERKNIEKDASFKAEYAKLGGGGIPITRIGGKEVVRGFSPERIGQALGLESR
jgi:glutaredoxin